MKSDSCMGMFDLTDDRRIYMLFPIPPSRRPALLVENGKIKPSYVVAGLLPEDGPERVHPVAGLFQALKLMGTVWDAVIARKAPKDAAAEERIAKAMIAPESMLSFIRESGVCGKSGSIQRAENYLRNVFALSHWFMAIHARNPRIDKQGRFKPIAPNLPQGREYYFLTADGVFEIGRDIRNSTRMKYDPGGMNWAGASRIINDVCRLNIPKAHGWEWSEFTGKSLKSFYEAHGLFPPAP